MSNEELEDTAKNTGISVDVLKTGDLSVVNIKRLNATQLNHLNSKLNRDVSMYKYTPRSTTYNVRYVPSVMNPLRYIDTEQIEKLRSTGLTEDEIRKLMKYVENKNEINLYMPAIDEIIKLAKSKGFVIKDKK